MPQQQQQQKKHQLQQRVQLPTLCCSPLSGKVLRLINEQMHHNTPDNSKHLFDHQRQPHLRRALLAPTWHGPTVCEHLLVAKQKHGTPCLIWLWASSS